MEAQCLDKLRMVSGGELCNLYSCNLLCVEGLGRAAHETNSSSYIVALGYMPCWPLGYMLAVPFVASINAASQHEDNGCATTVRPTRHMA